MRQSFKFRLLFAILLILFLGLFSQSLLKFFEDQKELLSLHGQKSLEAYHLVEFLMKHEKERLAVAADLVLMEGKIQKNTATRNKAALIGDLLPYYQRLKEQGIENLLIILPDGQTFYRFHEPNFYGDTILIRPLVQQVLAEKRPTFGLELGKSGAHLYYLLPIYDQKQKFVGVLQLGEKFEHFLKEISLQSPETLLFFLPATQENLMIYNSGEYVGRTERFGNWFFLGSNRPEEAKTILKNFLPENLLNSKLKFVKIDSNFYHFQSYQNSSFIVAVFQPVQTYQKYVLNIVREGVLQLFLLGILSGLLVVFTVNKSFKSLEEILKTFREVSLKGVMGLEPLKVNAVSELKEFIGGLNQLINYVREEYNELQEINQFQELLQQETREENVYYLIINLLKQKFNINKITILRLNESEDRFEEVLSTDKAGCSKNVFYKPELCKVLRLGKPLSTTDKIEFCPEYSSSNGYFCYPMIIGGRVRGVIQAKIPAESRFSTQKVVRYLALASPVIYNTRLLAKAQKKALEDQLTGLYNRRFMQGFLEKQLAISERTGQPLAFVMFDLDHFKEVNDVYGHLAGDELLKAVATIVQENIRRQDLAVRFGGDEFLLLLPATDRLGAAELAEKLRTVISNTTFPGCIGGIKVTASFGISLYPDDGRNPEELLRIADDFLYRAKKEGRNRIISGE